MGWGIGNGVLEFYRRGWGVITIFLNVLACISSFLGGFLKNISLGDYKDETLTFVWELGIEEIGGVLGIWQLGRGGRVSRAKSGLTCF